MDFGESYVETAFLLAVMENRDDDAKALVAGLLENEQTELLHVLEDALQIVMDTPPATRV